MANLKGPLFSIHAAGKLMPGLQIQQRHGGFHLIRTRDPRIAHTRRQRAMRAFTKALTQGWHHYASLWGDTWLAHGRAKSRSPYHAFLWENHLRRSLNLWPILAYGELASGAAPSIGAATFEASSQRLTGRPTLFGATRPWILAIFHTPLAGGTFTPGNAQAWDFNPLTGFPFHHLKRIAAGTYTMYLVAIDVWGRPSSSKSQAGLVVLP
jgi:hypothetical protein